MSEPNYHEAWLQTHNVCPNCKSRDGLSVDCDYGGYTFYCGSCYDADCSGDPLEFHSDNVVGRGRSGKEAVKDFWEQWAERDEWDEAQAYAAEQAEAREAKETT